MARIMICVREEIRHGRVGLAVTDTRLSGCHNIDERNSRQAASCIFKFDSSLQLHMHSYRGDVATISISKIITPIKMHFQIHFETIMTMISTMIVT